MLTQEEQRFVDHPLMEAGSFQWFDAKFFFIDKPEEVYE